MELSPLPSQDKLQDLHRVLFERFIADWKKITPHELLDLLSVKIEQALTFDELADRLNTKKRLSVKLGIDPTGPDVHMGHLVPIMLLRQFQKAGHAINLIIGDFTAMIGDPSGRDTQRSALTAAQVQVNKKTYLKQIAPYLNIKTMRVHHNAKWLSKLNAKQILADLQLISVGSVLQREDFRTRIEKGAPLSMAELLYGYLQGSDSLELKPDIEIGGRDQFLNLAFARDMMRTHKLPPQINITTPVLEGTDGSGRKMSKSYGNYVALTMKPVDIFGKIMSLPDALLVQYYKAFADLKKTEISHLEQLIKTYPLEMKKQLAQFLVAISTKKIKEGITQREAFEKKFSTKEIDMESLVIPRIKTSRNLSWFDLFKDKKDMIPFSNTELHRLFEEGAIKIIDPQEKIIGAEDISAAPCVVRVGKKIFVRII